MSEGLPLIFGRTCGLATQSPLSHVSGTGPAICCAGTHFRQLDRPTTQGIEATALRMVSPPNDGHAADGVPNTLVAFAVVWMLSTVARAQQAPLGFAHPGVRHLAQLRIQ
jgi:hypothetical protein